jgi:alpha-1,3-rhamnosyltransferase
MLKNSNEKPYPLISVLLPTYNHERYIKEAVESVLQQTYPNIELLVMNDGSQDNTWGQLQSLLPACEKRFSNTKFMQQTNSGVCTALNRLIRKSRGEYICLLAGDDLYKADFAQTLFDFLAQNPGIGVAVCDAELIDEEGKRFYCDGGANKPASPEEQVFETFGKLLQYSRYEVDFCSDEFGTYMSLLFGNYITQGRLMRAEFLKSFLFTDFAPLEDYYMDLQLSKITKYYYIDKVLYSYRRHGSSISQDNPRMLDITRRTLEHEAELLLQKRDYEHLMALKQSLKHKYKLAPLLKKLSRLK